MAGLRWIIENWVTALNAVGVVSGLFFTASSFRSETKTRRVANLLTVTANHRQLWADYYQYPTIARVLDPAADVVKQPVSREEEVFATLVVIHLASVFQALTDELVTSQEGLRRDVASFFSHPIPMAVWQRIKVLQNDAFVAYVESCLNWK